MAGIRGLVFRQLFDKVSSTYTYILGVADHAIIIDPVLETGSNAAQLHCFVTPPVSTLLSLRSR